MTESSEPQQQDVLPEEQPTADAEAEANTESGDDAGSAESERDAYLEALQRLQADFENYRKRMLKQQAEVSERAAEGLVSKLLPVLDTIDLAIAHEPNSGLEQVGAALREVLVKEGLERMVPAEQPFNPAEHEAVAHEPGEGAALVSEELRAGYRWKGRVLRPAMVKVIGS